MHHKRRRSKVRRAGCLRCKPHKGIGRRKTMHIIGFKSKKTSLKAIRLEVEE